MDDPLSRFNPPVPQRLSGHQVLRTIGVGERSRLLLARSSFGDSVVLKRYETSVAAEAIMHEAAILELVDDPHALRLLDIESDTEGKPMLVLDALRAGSLTELLAIRIRLSAGESVTALAPIIELMSRLHDAGIAHGAISADHIVFTAAGAPVLTGWGSALTRGAPEFASARERDLTALMTMVESLLPDVSATASRASGGLQLLAEALHRHARALPIAAEANSPDFAGLIPGSVPDAALEGRRTPDEYSHSVDLPIEQAPAAFDAVGSGRSATSQLLLGLAEWPEKLLAVLQRSEERRAGALSWILVGAAQRARESWHGLSPRLRMLAVAGAVAAAVSALLLFSAGGDDPAADASGDRNMQLDAPSLLPAETAPAAALGDDPEAALRGLLEARELCLAELSRACMSWVVQAGSAAEHDAVAILAGSEAASVPLYPLPPEFAVIALDRLGDSALFRVEPENAEPASVLVIRTEAGWRIRMLAAA